MTIRMALKQRMPEPTGPYGLWCHPVRGVFRALSEANLGVTGPVSVVSGLTGQTSRRGSRSRSAPERWAAGFPVHKTMEEFQLQAPSVPKATFDCLGSLEWI